MNIRQLGRVGAVVAASAMLALQLFAGVGQAAVPLATAVNVALPGAYSDGNDAGFRGTLTYTDASTLAKLFVHADITGGTGVPFVLATKNGNTVANACSVNASPLSVDCTFKTIRTNDVVRVTLGVTPASYVAGSTVSAFFTWSTTGFTTSDTGGTSHGDTWTDPNGSAVATASSDPDFAGGFDASSISTSQVLDAVTNPQATRLASLPAGVGATADDGSDNAFPCTSNTSVDCSALLGNWVAVSVGENATFGSTFQVQITYYKGTPKYFVHVYDALVGGILTTQQETITACVKKNTTFPCFTWSANTSTATIYTYHNGGFKGGI